MKADVDFDSWMGGKNDCIFTPEQAKILTRLLRGEKSYLPPRQRKDEHYPAVRQPRAQVQPAIRALFPLHALLWLWNSVAGKRVPVPIQNNIVAFLNCVHALKEPTPKESCYGKTEQSTAS